MQTQLSMIWYIGSVSQIQLKLWEGEMMPRIIFRKGRASYDQAHPTLQIPPLTLQYTNKSDQCHVKPVIHYMHYIVLLQYFYFKVHLLWSDVEQVILIGSQPTLFLKLVYQKHTVYAERTYILVSDHRSKAHICICIEQHMMHSAFIDWLSHITHKIMQI